MAFSSLKRRTRVEMVTISPTPAARARVEHRVEIGAELGKIEMAVAVDQHRR